MGEAALKIRGGGQIDECLEAYQKTGQEIPGNLRFCLEGMDQSGSKDLDELVFAQKEVLQR